MLILILTFLVIVSNQKQNCDLSKIYILIQYIVIVKVKNFGSVVILISFVLPILLGIYNFSLLNTSLIIAFFVLILSSGLFLVLSDKIFKS